MQEPDKNLAEFMNVISIGLKDRIASVATQALSSFENVMSNVGGIELHQQLKQNLDFVTMEVMDRIGDNNKAIKSKADQIAFLLS